ncbi:MAG: hypothetical protein QOC61_1560 [Acidobacteriota bacterium]|jgi:hypothetical protein|nr:hypothetical protein [Acidobacteriota bacterium]MDT5262556.1 hypothetical protein [Acidobacteriota bacterium]MDT7780230.1 hypothetical protein [Acidobacteriota bacterium]
MRRHKLLLFRLAVGLLAYFLGAAGNFYIRRPELCLCTELMCRVSYHADHPRLALQHPFMVAEDLVAPVCNQ